MKLKICILPSNFTVTPMEFHNNQMFLQLEIRQPILHFGSQTIFFQTVKTDFFLQRRTLKNGTTTACYFASIHTDTSLLLAEIIGKMVRVSSQGCYADCQLKETELGSFRVAKDLSFNFVNFTFFLFIFSHTTSPKSCLVTLCLTTSPLLLFASSASAGLHSQISCCLSLSEVCWSFSTGQSSAISSLLLFED